MKIPKGRLFGRRIFLAVSGLTIATLSVLYVARAVSAVAQEEGRDVPAAGATRVERDVTYTTASNFKAAPLYRGMRVHAGDTIFTGERSAAELDMEYAQVAVSARTAMRLNSLDGVGAAPAADLFMNAGWLEALIRGGVPTKSMLTVFTPTAVASLRGPSGIAVRYDPTTQKTTVYAAENAAMVGNTAGGEEIVVPAGHKVTVGKDGKISPPAQFSFAELSGAVATDESVSFFSKLSGVKTNIVFNTGLIILVMAILVYFAFLLFFRH